MTNESLKNSDAPMAGARNTCRLCTPYGAVLAMLGVENCVPLLHGSQGCSTYIRRHMIGHFREPVDVASSNFHESQAVFGGRENLFRAIENVTAQYNPEIIGIATTCLAETIGDNIPMFLHEFYNANNAEDFPKLLHVSTASYRGCHEDGFFATQRSLVEQFVPAEVVPESIADQINIMPAMLSCEDIRTLKKEVAAFGLKPIVLCDYSERLDGGVWDEYKLIPPGGTPVDTIGRMSYSVGSIELTTTQPEANTAATWLEENTAVPAHRLALPIGIRNCDAFYKRLAGISGIAIPDKLTRQRNRLVDAYIDGHKYLFDKKAIVYAEGDLAAGIVSMLLEVGIVPVICGIPGNAKAVRQSLIEADADNAEKVARIRFMSNADFAMIEEFADGLDIDLIIGNSNGLKLSRALGKPLLRVGMPVHDRIGAARMRLLGYSGTMEFFDRLCNLLINESQNNSPLAPIGYTHM